MSSKLYFQNILIIFFLVAAVSIGISGAQDDCASDRCSETHTSSSLETGENPKPAPSATEDQKGPKASQSPEPLKPFTPTEQIKADQAVDFPYDI